MSHQRFVTASVDGGKTFLAAVPLASEATSFQTAKGEEKEDVLRDGEGRTAKVQLGEYINSAAGPGC